MKPISDIETAVRGCTNPATGRLLAAYEWGLLAQAEEEAYEEHLMACHACAHELASTMRSTRALRSRPARPRRAWVPLGAAAAAAAVLAFSQLIAGGRSNLAENRISTDSVAAPVQQATMTFELSVPTCTQFSYELQVSGAS